MGTPRNRAETGTPSVLDLDLSSDSEADDGAGSSYTLATGQRQYASEEPNSQIPSELTGEQDRVVCAISESRSLDMIGVATINVTMGQVDLVRIVNDDRYRRLTETLLGMPTWPRTFLVLKKIVDEHSKSALAVCLEKEFPHAEVVPMDREHWNEAEGLKLVDRFAWRKHIKAIRRDLEQNFYVSCAFSAVRYH
jgi:DNA mismatch repair protein MSH4